MIPTDVQLEGDVVSQLHLNAAAICANIVVVVEGGVISLSGTVESYLVKYAAVRDAARTAGWRAIQDRIEVVLPPSSRRTDADIARAIRDRFRREMTVPEDSVQVRVAGGWVYLEGTTDWQYQQVAAEEAVRSLTGVRGITNRITLSHDTMCPVFDKYWVARAE